MTITYIVYTIYEMNLSTKYFNIIDKILPVGGIIRNLPYVMVFKTTNWCWYKCAHCCENSGPNQPHEYIPASVIKNYISQAIQDKNFTNEVVFTGGEIMSAYTFGDENYVRELLSFCGQNNIGTDIKTNAAWTNTKLATKIYDDLIDIIKQNRPYQFQISLSLDQFHPNSMQNCARFISKMACRPNVHAVIHISSFDTDRQMYAQLKSNLKHNGIRVDAAVIQQGNREIPVDIAQDKLILLPSTAELNRTGRAKNMPDAKPAKYPQFQILSSGHCVLMAFDSFGRVTLGENADKKINTKWRTTNGMTRPLWMVRRDLIKNAHAQEMYAKIFTNWKNK